MVSVALALATFFGVGYVSVVPGTFGSLAGLVLWAVLPHSIQVQAAVIVVTFAGGAWASGVAERHFQATDPSPVVVDEVMGMIVTLFMNQVGWLGAIAAFFLFRFFDVVKAYPTNRLERLPGGVGVMADDFMAAVYANIALRAMLALGHWIIR